MGVLSIMRPKRRSLPLAVHAEDAPPIVVHSASELARHTAPILRELQTGAVVQVVDVHRRRVAGYLTLDPPGSVAHVVHLLPSPGDVLDHIPGEDDWRPEDDPVRPEDDDPDRWP